MWLVRDPEQIIRSFGIAAQMGFLSSAKHHDLIEANGLRMFESKDGNPIKLTGQQTCAGSNGGSWNDEHQHPLDAHPAIAVFQEHKFHPLVTMRSNLGVVRWIQVQK